MQLPGRISAAIDVLQAMEQSHRPAALVLKDWGQSHRFAGSGDRAAIGNLVYDALRRRSSHAYLMDSDAARALVLSVVVRDWGENPEALVTTFASDKFAPDAISQSELKNLTASSVLEGAPDHIRADLPEWLVESFHQAFGDAWIAEGAALTERPSLDMRCNTLKSDRDRVLKSLKRFDPVASPYAANGIRIPAGARDSRTPNVQADEAYLKGWFEVQDEGSQMVAEFSGAKPGMQILDYCAGAGGKSLALAAAMENKGQIFAHDADRTRLAPIYDRIKRAGVRNIQTRPPEPGALDTLVNKMDMVLVDAPCTGTGTWRRRPDTKWRLTQEQLNQRVNDQREILEQAAQYVRPGGQLTYITCSILPEENTTQIEQFLSTHPEFTSSDTLSEGNPLKEFTVENKAILLSPHRSQTDGFFATNLSREP